MTESTSEAGTPGNEPFEDLLRDPGVWTQWSPRKETQPRFDVDVDGGLGGRAALAISGGREPARSGIVAIFAA